MESTSRSKSKHPHVVAAFFGVFGLYLLAGAFASLFRGRWPAFMPPLLDALAVPLSLLSQALGAAVGAIVAAVLGVLCLVFCARLLAKASHG